MGYPMRSGYRGSAASNAPSGGFQTSGGSPPAPANDPVAPWWAQPGAPDVFNPDPSIPFPGTEREKQRVARRALRLWVRQNPWLRAAQTAWELYELYNLFNSSGFNVNCTRSATSCVHEMAGYSTGFGTCTGLGGLPGSLSVGQAVTQFIEVHVFKTCFPGSYAQWKGYTTADGAAHVPLRPYRMPRHPQEWPFFDPWGLPVTGFPMESPPTPWPALPYRPRPGADPSPWPLPDPRLPPVTRPGADPAGDPPGRPEPPAKPEPPVRPGRPPLVGSGVSPRPQTRSEVKGTVEAVRQDAAPRYKPPGKRTTEAKLGGQGARLVYLLAHVVTESKDVIEAMWKALPNGLKTRSYKHGNAAEGKFGKRGGPLTWDKAKDVLSGIKKLGVDDPRAQKFWNDAVDNLIQNQMEDFVHGKLGKAVGAQSRRSGRPVGYASGPAL
ncbi:hypothetical protein [Bradyrhizobium iriomotense]|uniref:hypothetical protein n=1 Tax=Bradyrhizobium iriomotense TaxID=441950 RepID=UPI001B8A322C|nr:hypothetical protein [Bradyrhizobium iriomotense]MBR1134129.1 hypothetical protein [Bradyrhizobium iriomotense]